MRQQAAEKYQKCLEDKTTDPEFFGLCRTIRVDVPRTFPSLEICENPNTFTKDLTEILESYIIFRPSVGYVCQICHSISFILGRWTNCRIYFVQLLNMHIFACSICFFFF